MEKTINRRQWLKTSAAAAVGLAAGFPHHGCRRRTPDPIEAPQAGRLIRLHLNESPYGLSPSARRAGAEALELAHQYPHKRYVELKQLIASSENLPPDHIILGAGSTEIMTTLIHLHAAGKEAVVALPTYYDFIDYAERVDCRLRWVPLDAEFAHDLQAMAEELNSETGLVYICNPNNPTGSITPADKISAFIDLVSEKSLVIVDEAYHEYVEQSSYRSMVDHVRKKKNVMVMRTFSKIYGLAGMRVGYGLARPDIIEKMERLERNFASIAYPSLMASQAAYRDRAFIARVKAMNKEARAYLCRELDRLGLFFVPSQTNFVLFRIDSDGEEMVKMFEEQGLLLRSLKFNGGDWLRVSLGEMKDMRTFVSLLSGILGSQFHSA